MRNRNTNQESFRRIHADLADSFHRNNIVSRRGYHVALILFDAHLLFVAQDIVGGDHGMRIVGAVKSHIVQLNRDLQRVYKFDNDQEGF